MTWALSGEKEAGIQSAIDEFMVKKTCTWLEIQKLHGKLLDFALSCEFMLGFRHHLIQLLGKFGNENSASKRLIPDQLKEDLWVWKKAVATSRLGLPLKEIWCQRG